MRIAMDRHRAGWVAGGMVLGSLIGAPAVPGAVIQSVGLSQDNSYAVIFFGQLTAAEQAGSAEIVGAGSLKIFGVSANGSTPNRRHVRPGCGYPPWRLVEKGLSTPTLRSLQGDFEFISYPTQMEETDPTVFANRAKSLVTYTGMTETRDSVTFPFSYRVAAIQKPDGLMGTPTLRLYFNPATFKFSPDGVAKIPTGIAFQFSSGPLPVANLGNPYVITATPVTDNPPIGAHGYAREPYWPTYWCDSAVTAPAEEPYAGVAGKTATVTINSIDQTPFSIPGRKWRIYFRMTGSATLGSDYTLSATIPGGIPVPVSTHSDGLCYVDTTTAPVTITVDPRLDGRIDPHDTATLTLVDENCCNLAASPYATGKTITIIDHSPAQNAAPTIVTAPRATPAVISGGTFPVSATLSVLAADANDGEASLQYCWKYAGNRIGDPGIAFAPTNGTNAAKQMNVSFTQNGDFDIQVMVRDPAGAFVYSPGETSYIRVSVSGGQAPTGSITYSSLAGCAWAGHDALIYGTTGYRDGSGFTYLDAGTTDPGTIPSTTPLFGLPGTGGPGSANGANARIIGMVFDQAGNLYAADSLNAVIRRVTPTGVVTTYAGNRNEPAHVDGPLASARFLMPFGLCIDAGNNISLVSYTPGYGNVIRKITPAGMVSTIAGSGNIPVDGQGTTASFCAIGGMAQDGAGNLYVTDGGGYTDANGYYVRCGAIRKITPGGMVSTIAGGLNVASSTVVDGVGSLARFASPGAMAIDRGNGVLYVFDRYTIRTVALSNNQVTTIAGVAGQVGWADGQGSAVRFSTSGGMVFGKDGLLYIGDGGDPVYQASCIRSVTSTGVVATLTSRSIAYPCDGIGLNAGFGFINSMTLNASGTTMAIADQGMIRLGAMPSAPVLPAPPSEPAITWTAPAPIIYGTVLSATQLNAGCAAAGTLTYDPPPGTLLAAGTRSLRVSFWPSDTARYAPTSKTVTLTVQQKPLQAIADAAVRTYGAANPVFTARVTGVVAGDGIQATASCSATTTSNAGAYAIVPAILDPKGVQANYAITRTNGTLTIAKAAGTVTLSGLAVTYNGSPRAATATTIPAGKAVAITYAGSTTAPTAAGSYAILAAINDANYQGSATGTLIIAKATPVITWKDPVAGAAPQMLSSTQLNAVSNVSGSFVYVPAAGTALFYGVHALKTVFTPTDAANYQQATRIVNWYLAGEPVPPLPSPWKDEDVGSPRYSGVAYGGSTSPASFTVIAGGADIWGTMDRFHFVHQQPIIASGEITARVDSLARQGTGTINSWAKAGVMVRGTAAAGSANAFMAISPANGATFQSRATNGAVSTSSIASGTKAPYWVRLRYVAGAGSMAVSGYLSVDGTNWTQLGSTRSVAITGLPQVGLAVTAHDDASLATATFSNVQILASPGTGTGLRGTYFANQTLSGTAALSRTDAQVNFTWAGAPVTGVPADHFSVRWTGQVEAQSTGTYTFTTTSDDGVRLWVGGQKLIDNWTNHGPTANSGQITFELGQRYDVVMEYYDYTSGAVARLEWAGPGVMRQVVPTVQLYPTPTGVAMVPRDRSQAPDCRDAVGARTGQLRILASRCSWYDLAP